MSQRGIRHRRIIIVVVPQFGIHVVLWCISQLARCVAELLRQDATRECAGDEALECCVRFWG